MNLIGAHKEFAEATTGQAQVAKDLGTSKVKRN